jgi:hypothetical protein
MPRYVVERDHGAGLNMALDEIGLHDCLSMVHANGIDGVTWLHSYFSTDNKKSFCIYDGPNPEAIRRAASRNHWPVNHITEVRVLDPYFYRPR